MFYDLEVPDFRKEKLMMGGLLLTAASVQQTPSIQPDPVVAKLLPGAATSRREFPKGDVLALYTEIYDNIVRTPAAPLRCDGAAAVGERHAKCSSAATRFRTARRRVRSRGRFTAIPGRFR